MTLALAVVGLLLFMAVPLSRPNVAKLMVEHRYQLERLALEELSRAVEAYHNDHGAWPGARPAEAGTLDEKVYEEDWLQRQLRMYTDAEGRVVPQELTSHPFGPYLEDGIPLNPSTGLRSVRVLAEGEEGPGSVRDGIYGWIYDPRTGAICPHSPGLWMMSHGRAGL